MELIKGVPITKFCDGRRLPLRERLLLFVQVCRAVQHAHLKGLIHCDIKPSNVLHHHVACEGVLGVHTRGQFAGVRLPEFGRAELVAQVRDPAAVRHLPAFSATTEPGPASPLSTSSMRALYTRSASREAVS